MTALLPRSAWTTEPVPSGRPMLDAAAWRSPWKVADGTPADAAMRLNAFVAFE